jgi:hypothetical protein
VLSVLVWRGEKYFLLVWKESISILWKIEMLFWRERKGILAANKQTSTSNMDSYIATAPLNAKGTCFRIVVVPQTIKKAKHIKTAKKN